MIIPGWFSFPYFSTKELQVGDEWIAGEIEHSERTFYRAERSVLFRSGQFLHIRSFDEIAQLGNRVHVLEVLDTVTAAFEFAARIAEQNVLSPVAVMTFGLLTNGSASLGCSAKRTNSESGGQSIRCGLGKASERYDLAKLKNSSSLTSLRSLFCIG